MEGEDEGVVGGVSMVSLGLGLSEVDVVAVADEPREEGSGLRVVGEEGLSFRVDEFPVGEGSMAETSPHTRRLISDPPSAKAG